MFRMNKWAWVGIGGGIAGVLIGALSVLTTVPRPEGLYIAVGFLVIFGGMGVLFYKLFFAPMINVARLQKTGISGKATILEVKDTNVTINNNPQVKLTLEIKNSLGQRYRTTTRVLVSRINPFAYQPGMEVPVKIDPKNDQNVALDFSNSDSTAQVSAGNTLTAGNATLLQSDIEQTDAENKSVLASGIAARAIIRKNTWLGVYVNGNNPFVELELEVLPDTSPAFSGKTRGVISEAALTRYQPGCEIYVKYDRYDNSKIAVDHS